jgi:hypothetical protein
MIDEYFSSNPQAKWAALALLAVYIWFMVLGIVNPFHAIL